MNRVKSLLKRISWLRILTSVLLPLLAGFLGSAAHNYYAQKNQFADICKSENARECIETNKLNADKSNQKSELKRYSLNWALPGANSDIYSLSAISSISSYGDLLLSSGGENKNITISPTGDGSVNIDGLKWPTSDSDNGKVLQTDGSGQLSFVSRASTGENSDITSLTKINSISSDGPLSLSAGGANKNISLSPSGTGNLILDGFSWPTSDGNSGQALRTDGSGNLTFGPRGAMYSNGSIYFTSSAQTTISTIGTYVKAAGTSDSIFLNNWDTNSTNNRLRYIGAEDVHAHIAVTVSMTAVANNETIGLRVVKNGNASEKAAIASTVERFVSTGADIGSTALHADFNMSTNDYIELWVTNTDSATGITVDYMYFFVLAQPSN
ncbi:hypothetical protein ACFL1M_01400 [Patescibacteria group bacterium]